MSRQFRCFLLPSDIDAVIAKLQRKVGLTLIDPHSSGPGPTSVGTPLRKDPPLPGQRASVSANCYLAQPGGEVKFNFIAKQGYWLVHEERSEVIQFIGFEFDGNVLLEGRFYFQTDFLLGNAIWPKRDEFLRWADRIFRVAKGSLSYSRELNSYVGKAASEWRNEGGRFAWMRVSGRLLLAEEDHRRS